MACITQYACGSKSSESLAFGPTKNEYPTKSFSSLHLALHVSCVISGQPMDLCTFRMELLTTRMSITQAVARSSHETYKACFCESGSTLASQDTHKAQRDAISIM